MPKWPPWCSVARLGLDREVALAIDREIERIAGRLDGARTQIADEADILDEGDPAGLPARSSTASNTCARSCSRACSCSRCCPPTPSSDARGSSAGSAPRSSYCPWTSDRRIPCRHDRKHMLCQPPEPCGFDVPGGEPANSTRQILPPLRKSPGDERVR
jgi:hypothetical protein